MPSADRTSRGRRSARRRGPWPHRPREPVRRAPGRARRWRRVAFLQTRAHARLAHRPHALSRNSIAHYGAPELGRHLVEETGRPRPAGRPERCRCRGDRCQALDAQWQRRRATPPGRPSAVNRRRRDTCTRCDHGHGDAARPCSSSNWRVALWTASWTRALRPPGRGTGDELMTVHQQQWSPTQLPGHRCSACRLPRAWQVHSKPDSRCSGSAQWRPARPSAFYNGSWPTPWATARAWARTVTRSADPAGNGVTP